MTTNLLTLRDTDSVARARALMAEHHIRHIPILDQAKQFVGLLSQRDVLASTVSILAEVDAEEVDALEASIPIREVMSTHVTVVDEDTELRAAAQAMLDHRYGCLPVVSGANLVGIITETDFLILAIRLLDRASSS
jgi:CBS domain-containing membrane protein